MNPRLEIEIPKGIGLSHLYSSKPSEDKFKVTKAKCELSMAWRDILIGAISKFSSETKSLILSTSFFY